jgi:WD40 repeat protein
MKFCLDSQVWDILSRKIHNLLRVPEATVNSISFALDSYTIASGGTDGTVRLWDIDTENMVSLPNEKEVKAVAFSPDSGYLAVGLAGGFIRVWDVRQGHVLTHP